MPDKMNLKGRDKRGMNVEIELKTEPEKNIPGFIVGNALCPTCQRPTPANEFMAQATPDPCDCDPPIPPGRHPMVEQGSKNGGEIAICGAGPSLEGFIDALGTFKGDVWGANRALNYLHDRGINADGVAIDPSTRMFGQVWTDPPDVTYYLATTVNPGLVWWLEKHDRDIRYFHSLRNCKGEMELYRMLYPDTVLAGHGLNVVNRAIDVAEYMGYTRIYVAGADNALGKDGEFYAGGGDATNAGDVTLKGEINGRLWETKTDMLMSAVELVRRKRDLKQQGVRLIFVGDTLPRALESKSEAFLRRVIDWRENQAA